VRYLVSGPAMDRLGWILDGLNGAVDWGSDAAEVLAPEFAELVPPEVLAKRVRQRAEAFAPCAVTGLDTSDHTAQARVRVRDGSVQVVTRTVEPAAPHRIRTTRTVALIPVSPDAAVAGRLHRVPGTHRPRCGCPADRVLRPAGNGQEHAGAGHRTAPKHPGVRGRLAAQVADPFGGNHLDDLLKIGAELLTTLAYRQLDLGQSAILDFPAEDPGHQDRQRHAPARRCGRSR
jgi:hypothetical protein